jgi:hypothetical protein
MQNTHAMLLLDDGELDAVCALLEHLGLPYTRLRGSEVGDEIEPPESLLIVTPRHASKVRCKSPDGALPGRPNRIVAIDEDSPALRRQLRNMGFSTLVRLPASDQVWRLLVQRALYQGDERRRETRLPVSAQISLTQLDEAVPATEPARSALLADISNRGCHVVADEPFALKARIFFTLSPEATGSKAVELSGSIIRTGPWDAHTDTPRFSAAVAFDPDMPDASRVVLACMLNARIRGPKSLAPQLSQELSLPSCASPVLPGLKLDDETDPAIATQFEIELSTTSTQEFNPDNQRKNRRVDYQQRIEAATTNNEMILLGRDLSSGGMRVERFADAKLGAHLELALYGLADSTPLVVDAEVVRDDGERGIALRFLSLPRGVAAELENFITCLPAVESLEDGEELGIGSVLTQVRKSSN